MTIHEKSCGTVVCYQPGAEILLLHYPEGHWDLPKGHIEEGEDEIKTALRELEEETGLKNIKILKGFKESIHYFFTRKKAHEKELVSKTVVFFLVKSHDRKIKISDEHQDFIWLPFDEAVKKITFKNVKEIVMKAKKHIDKLK
ncbi:NUDIX domain-containing protein [Candidatus Peregrinibacteria bacterium]|nr:NUDIX domain-containing protein [Candidatus Peregrinibacteria bacterium]